MGAVSFPLLVIFYLRSTAQANINCAVHLRKAAIGLNHSLRLSSGKCLGLC